MKFIYADSLDFIDPNDDFATESPAPGRQVYWDDRYPHEYLRTPPYDGILVSRGIVGDHRTWFGFGSCETLSNARAERLRSVGITERTMSRRTQWRRCWSPSMFGVAPKCGRAQSIDALHEGSSLQCFNGDVAGSTLRLPLGCLLAESLGIDLRRVGGGRQRTFADGERCLSEWMERNARVC